MPAVSNLGSTNIFQRIPEKRNLKEEGKLVPSPSQQPFPHSFRILPAWTVPEQLERATEKATATRLTLQQTCSWKCQKVHRNSSKCSLMEPGPIEGPLFRMIPSQSVWIVGRGPLTYKRWESLFYTVSIFLPCLLFTSQSATWFFIPLLNTSCFLWSAGWPTEAIKSPCVNLYQAKKGRENGT